MADGSGQTEILITNPPTANRQPGDKGLRAQVAVAGASERAEDPAFDAMAAQYYGQVPSYLLRLRECRDPGGWSSPGWTRTNNPPV